MRVLRKLLLIVILFPSVFAFNVQINTHLPGVLHKDGITYIYAQPSEVLHLDRLFIVERTGEHTLDPKPPINYVFIIDTSKDSQALKYVKMKIDRILNRLSSVGSDTRYAVIGVSDNPVIHSSFKKKDEIKSVILGISENAKWNKHYISLEKALSLVKELQGGIPSGYLIVLVFVDKGPINWNSLVNYIVSAGKVYILYSSDTNHDSMNTVSTYAIMSPYARVIKYTDPKWIDYVIQDMSKTVFKKAYLLKSKYSVPYGSEVNTRGQAFYFKHSSTVGYVGILFKAPSQLGEYIEEMCIVQVDTGLRRCFKVHYIVGRLIEADVKVIPQNIRDNMETYVSVVLHNKLPTSETVNVQFIAEVDGNIECRDSKLVRVNAKGREPVLFSCYIKKREFSFAVKYKVKLDNGLVYTIEKYVRKRTAEIVSKAYILYSPLVFPEHFSYVISKYKLDEKEAMDKLKSIVSYLRTHTRMITTQRIVSDYAYKMLKLYTT